MSITHPTLRHPITGQPLTALGATKSGRLIWPVMGGSQPAGEPAPNPNPAPAPPGPSPLPHPGQPNPAGPPMPPMFPPGMPHQQPGMPPGHQPSPQHPQHPPSGVNENGYPDNTPLQAMSPEQQAAYWRTYARRNEDRIKQMGDYAQLKEQADAYQKLLADTQTEQQKAVAAAEARGRSSALAEAGAQMVEAYVRAAATGRMNDDQVSTLLQGLDRTRFVNPSTGGVDAQMIAAYVQMLAPNPATPAGWPAPAYAPPVPAGQFPPGTTATPVPALPGQAPPQLYPSAQPGGAWSTYPPQQQPPQNVPQQPDMGAGRQVPSYGQAQYSTPPASGFEAGRAFARTRFKSDSK